VEPVTLKKPRLFHANFNHNFNHDFLQVEHPFFVQWDAEFAGVENAGVEISGKMMYGKQSLLL